MSLPTVVIGVVTFVFGILPASLLVVWAALLGAVGLAAMFQLGDPAAALSGLLAAVSAVLAVFGYAALFHAARDAIDAKVARGLACGIAANLFGVGFFIVTEMGEWSSPGDWFVLVSPLVVGVTHFARYLARGSR